MRHLHDEEHEESSMRKKTKRRAFGAAAKATKWTPAQRAAWKKKMDAAKKAKGRFGAKAKPKAVVLSKSEAAPAKKAAPKKAAPKKAAKKAAPKKAAKKAAPKKAAAKKSSRPKNVPAKPRNYPKSIELTPRAKNARPGTRLVPPHLAGSASVDLGGEGRGRPCKKCGEAHTISEHWSHRYMHGTQTQRINYRCKKGGTCAFNLAALIAQGKKGDKASARTAQNILEKEAYIETNPRRLAKLKEDWANMALALAEKFPKVATQRA
jgi:hypothetical protein